MTRPARDFRIVLIAGLAAGTLDIADAFIFYGLKGVGPVRILQSIAGGILGRSAFRGGLRTALLGAALHFLIALSAAAVYRLASRRIVFLRTQAVLSGLLYGALIYAFMNAIVLPLSRAGAPPFSPGPFINGVLAVVLLVGLPIALICRSEH